MVNITQVTFKNKYILLNILFCFLLTFSSQAQRIVGYTTSWSGDANDINYNNLTHINYSFALPTAAGGILPVENPNKLNGVVTQAHNNGVKVLIAIGGWDLGDGGGNDSRFNTLASTPAGRSNFVNNVINFIQQYNLDGADIDWEFPEPINGNPDPNFTALMSDLSNALHSRGLLLTAAVNASAWAADGISNQVFNSVDWLNIMAYDGDAGAGHAPYSYAVSALNYFKSRGLPADKAVVGVPFYARPSWKAYSTLLAEGADPYGDYHNGDYYNGINTIKSKTKLAKEQGGGIMIWAIDHDTRDQYSLLQAISDEMNLGNPPAVEPVSWESHNISGAIIRHADSRGRIDGNVNPAADGNWRMVQGLAGAGISFQSENFPNRYLRHRGGEIWLDDNDGSQLFKNDATFHQRVGLADGSKVSFESYNFPGRYIRHRNSLLFSETIASDLDRNDATFGHPGGNTGVSQTIEAELYNSMSGVENEACTEGGQNVGYVDTGDWMAYPNVNFPSSGNYLIEYRVASDMDGSVISSDINAGGIVLGQVTIPNTGGWQNWVTVSHTVYVNAGTYPFGIYAQVGGWNLNWIKITAQGSAKKLSEEFTTRSIDRLIELYPNPAINELSLTGVAKGSKIAVVNIAGQVIKREVFNGSSDASKIDISSLTSGMYFIKIEGSNSSEVLKFMKK